MNFYLSKNGQKLGPCSVEQIRAFLIQDCFHLNLSSNVAGTTVVPAKSYGGEQKQAKAESKIKTMLTNKDVIVVAPNQYKGLARKLSHEIAKRGGLNGACWTIKDYEDNESQVGSVCSVILLGNAEENKLTKDYLPLVGDKLENRAGACFGYDGSKALIFGEGKLEQVGDFQKLFKEVISTRHTILAAILGPVGIRIPTLTMSLARVIYKTLDNRAKKQKLLRHQTEVAVTLFLTDKFDQMVGIKKTD